MLIFLSLALFGALLGAFGMALLLFPDRDQRITRELLELMWGDRAQSFVMRGATIVGIVMAVAGSALICIGLVMYFDGNWGGA